MKCPKCQTDNLSDSKFCKECAEPLTSSPDNQGGFTKTLETSGSELSPGSVFARKYQIVEELGRGGMGRVYRVFDREVEEFVALKLIKPEIAADKNTIQRFRNELKLARKISHKHVCRMFDLNREGDTHFITMEFVPGEDLKSSLRRMGPLSLGKAVFIAKQVCEGLAEAHRMGVVHRDLKPQNIMIDRDGNARIMDFGIARSLEAKGVTDSGGVIGTPEYMSPEQVEGKAVDARSDIYSMGAILYELVTGQVPFEGNTPMSVALKHVTAAPVEPRGLNADIPEAFSHVIMKCMEKDKERRFQSVEELLQALNDTERELPTTHRVVPKTKTSASKEITVTLNSKLIVIPLALICLVVVLGVMTWRIFFSPQPQEMPATSPPTIQLESQAPQKESVEEKPEPEPESPPEEVRIKPAVSQVEPEKMSVASKKKPEVTTELNRGVQAFKQGNYAETVKQMEAVLSKDPDNSSARYYLAEAGKKEQERRKKQEIGNLAELAQTAYQAENYQECLDYSRKVLERDPKHAEAAGYLQSAAEKLAAPQIHALVDRFIQSWKNKTLPEFYQDVCSERLYQQNKNDAGFIMAAYASFQAVASDITIDYKAFDHFVARFSNITTGVRARDGRRQVIFEGSYEWEVVQKESKWQIIGIKARVIDKRPKSKEEK